MYVLFSWHGVAFISLAPGIIFRITIKKALFVSYTITPVILNNDLCVLSPIRIGLNYYKMCRIYLSEGSHGFFGTGHSLKGYIRF